ncbi:neugrin [Syngnathoides biaculeatus]|uniref:neugrin n=1 Tax=Syngnathoides biaculeatus TaxID=300417 RepID=UPI002ADD4DEA|nr:neugrin [Syngnathoides biaculeatus]
MAVGRLHDLLRCLRAGSPRSVIHWCQTPLCPPSAFRDASNSSSSSRLVGRRGRNGTSRNEDSDEEDSIMEEVEDKLGALLEEGVRKRKTIKYNIMRRKMTPSGAPERNLTWEAMETIRYLKREHPDEWTVARLSEGFSVSPDVIQRVVRTKFSPAPHRRAQQDAKVRSRLQHPELSSGATGIDQSQPGLHAEHSLRRLSAPGKPEAALVPVTVDLDAPAPKAPILVPVTQTSPKDAAAPTIWPGQEGSGDAEQDETWDGQVLSEEELEKFMDIKPAPVLRVGNDFFDGNGHFLYRV